jgi:hypothetical protein
MKTRYITDEAGKKISVVLPVSDYEKILEKLEELEDIKAYDEALSGEEEAFSVQQVFSDIESKYHGLGS